MKLGICYMVFDGEELLEFAIKSIRSNIDYISVTYQSVSYWGNLASTELEPYLFKLKEQGLIDNLIHYNTDLSKTPKENELILRNIGLQASKEAGCSHHISADVDEFYKPDELEYAKKIVSDNDYDFITVPMECYYKNPSWLIVPSQNFTSSFIHRIDNEYVYNSPTYPFPGELTRTFRKGDHYKLLTKEEFTLHHMSFVRKDIRKKWANNDNANYINVKNFIKRFENYKCGEKVILIPDFVNRKTVFVENVFNINI